MDNTKCLSCMYLYTDSKAYQSALYGQGSGSIWLDDVVCTGKESSLLSCGNRGLGVHNCGHYEDASVECEGVVISID